MALILSDGTMLETVEQIDKYIDANPNPYQETTPDRKACRRYSLGARLADTITDDASKAAIFAECNRLYQKEVIDGVQSK